MFQRRPISKSASEGDTTQTPNVTIQKVRETKLSKEDELKRQSSQRKQLAMAKKVLMMIGLLITFILVLASPFIYLVYTRLGFGASFPKQPFLATTPAVLPATALEIVAELPIPPGNLAVSSRNRVFFNFHPEYNSPLKIVELVGKQNYKAFPDMKFQSEIKTVLSMRIDSKDRLWLLDFAGHAMYGSPRLYGFNLKKKDELIVNYTFPSNVAGFGSMLNDFQIDPNGEYIYIVDTSIVAADPGIIVYSIAKNKSCRIFSSHPSMFGSSVFLNISGAEINFGPFGMKIHVDSVALDRTGGRLYFGAVTSNKLFSITTNHLTAYAEKVFALNDTSSPPIAWENSIRDFIRLVSSEKPATDGLSSDGAGNIWMTAIEHSSIVLGIPITMPVGATANSKTNNGVSDVHTFRMVKVVESRELLRWPDGLSFGPDGLYITCSALQYKFLSQNVTNQAPFHILKISTKHLKNKKIYPQGKYFSLPAAGQ